MVTIWIIIIATNANGKYSSTIFGAGESVRHLNEYMLLSVYASGLFLLAMQANRNM